MNFKKENFIQVHGELFNDVQLNGIFKDSKTFVDSIPKLEPGLITEFYKKEKNKSNFDLKNFINENFILPSEEIREINLPEKRTMKEHIKFLWDILKRDHKKNVDEYSTLIPIPKPYIIPGGRFREIYYWDSYFTMQGLLADGEVKIVEQMLDNFKFLIEEIGFIPNGNRVYYTTRSQPPFFAAMVDLLCKFKNDYNTGLKYLSALEKEYSFWCKNYESENNSEFEHKHLIFLEDGNFLNRYFDPSGIPREESYLEDFKTAGFLNDKAKPEFYRNLRSACESGWDFSSRWFEDKKSITKCISTQILPVDLNSALFFLEELISKLNELKGDNKKNAEFKKLSGIRTELINKIFWSSKDGFYFDYNWKKSKQLNVYSLAACYPLYFKIAEKKAASSIAKKIEKEFLKDGGVLSTLNFTGQQWDAPNGWAPLQWITIKGLMNYGFNDLAEKIKSRWLNLNENVFSRTGKMFEKYNVVDTSLFAAGGEYDLQDGFGWTNGVARALMEK